MQTGLRILEVGAWAIALLVFYIVAHDYPKMVRAREWHHGYLGDLFVLLGVLLGGWFHLAAALGLWWRWDDSYEHVMQIENKDPDYASPWHRWFAKHLWPSAFWRWLARLLDALVGRVFGKAAA